MAGDVLEGASLPDGIEVDETAAYFGITESSDIVHQLMEMDFSGALYKDSNSNANYNKCIFSKRCEAPWEGIDTLCA